MRELIVIGYDDVASAEKARDALFKLCEEYLVDVADAVIATVDHNEKIQLNQMVNTWSVGMAGGAAWGLVAGLVFFAPIVGLLSGAVAGALAGALSDYGINDAFMRDVANILRPGQAALFIMVKQHAPEKVIEELARYGGGILRTNLDPSQEGKLREAFAYAHRNLALRNNQGD